MRERPIEDKPSLLEVVLVLLLIILVMAFAGKVDYQDALERDNRALAAENNRLRQAMGMSLRQAVGMEISVDDLRSAANNNGEARP